MRAAPRGCSIARAASATNSGAMPASRPISCSWARLIPLRGREFARRGELHLGGAREDRGHFVVGIASLGHWLNLASGESAGNASGPPVSRGDVVPYGRARTRPQVSQRAHGGLERGQGRGERSALAGIERSQREGRARAAGGGARCGAGGRRRRWPRAARCGRPQDPRGGAPSPQLRARARSRHRGRANLLGGRELSERGGAAEDEDGRRGGEPRGAESAAGVVLDAQQAQEVEGVAVERLGQWLEAGRGCGAAGHAVNI